jgi:hypothetical protein
MRNQLSLRQLEHVCDRWNARHPVGTPVIYHPVIGEKAGRSTKTTMPASILSGHSAVLFVEGVAGCVALEAVEPIEPAV